MAKKDEKPGAASAAKPEKKDDALHLPEAVAAALRAGGADPKSAVAMADRGDDGWAVVTADGYKWRVDRNGKLLNPKPAPRKWAPKPEVPPTMVPMSE